MSESETRGQAQGRLVTGRYRLVRELGRGGMGVVWLAEDLKLRRQVAVKELRPPPGLPEADSDLYQERALREAQSAARIQHANAVALHDVLQAADGAVYLIMELVDGPTLAELIQRDGALPATRVASLGLQLLNVLAAAHALGIVHRDVKPANIMVAGEDEVKLTDFGIAHTLGDTRLTRTGVVGTHAYVAPELFDSEPITPAADLWSLGATLYHAADGHGAFNRDSTGATLRAILVDDIPAPHCEPHLAAAITGMLEREPGRRATIEQARAGLLQAAQQPAAEPRPDAEPRPRSNQDSTTRWRPLKLPRDTPAGDAPVEHPARRLPGRRTVIAGAALLAAAGATGGVLAARAGSGSAGRALTPRVTITGPPDAAADEIAFSATGTLLAVFGATSTIAASLWDAASGTEIASLPYGSRISDVAFSPDGQMLAVADSYLGVNVWGIPDRSPLVTLPGLSFTNGFFAVGLAFSPDGGTLAIAGGQRIGLWDFATQAWTTQGPVSAATSGLTTVAFSPNGQTLAAGDRGSGYVYVWNVSARSLIATVAPPATDDLPGPGRWIAFSPDSGTLAISSFGIGTDFRGVRFWNVTKRAVVSALAHPGADGVNAIAFSPRGRVLAVVGANGNVYLWDIATWRLITAQPVPGRTAITDVAFSSDGNTLAAIAVDQRIYVWTVAGLG